LANRLTKALNKQALQAAGQQLPNQPLQMTGNGDSALKRSNITHTANDAPWSVTASRLEIVPVNQLDSLVNLVREQKKRYYIAVYDSNPNAIEPPMGQGFLYEKNGQVFFESLPNRTIENIDEAGGLTQLKWGDPIVYVKANPNGDIYSNNAFISALRGTFGKTIVIESNWKNPLLGPPYDDLKNFFARPISEQTAIKQDLEREQLRQLWDRLQSRLKDVGSLPLEHPAQKRLDRVRQEIDELRMAHSTTIGVSDGKLAARNWQVAENKIQEWVLAKEDLSLERILEINKIIGENLLPFENNGTKIAYAAIEAGAKFGRLREIVVGTGNFNYIHPSDVPEAMQDFLAWYKKNEKLLPPEWLAIEAYQRLISIHPFSDGNGRTCRLIANWILRRHGLPAVALDEKNLALFPARGDSNLPPDYPRQIILDGIRKSVRLYEWALEPWTDKDQLIHIEPQRGPQP